MRKTLNRQTALEVSASSVRFCTWNGKDAHHAHSIYHLVPGAVVSVGDDVPPEAIGDSIAFHWYRRIADRCVMARGDGTLFEELPKAD